MHPFAEAVKEKSDIIILVLLVYIDVGVTMFILDMSLVTHTGITMGVSKYPFMNQRLFKALILMKSLLLYMIFAMASERV